MAMSTEQAMAYLKKDEPKEVTKEPEETKAEEAKEPDKKEEAPSAEPEPKATESEDTHVSSPEDSDKDDGGQKEPEAKGSDEPGKKEPDVKDKESKRDYAFVRMKDKNRKLKDKYDSLNQKFEESTRQKDARIKELEAQLKKYEPLKSEDFRKPDGSVDIDAYTDWKIQQKGMQDEVQNLRQSMTQEQARHAVEYDQYVTEKCFSGKELDDYNDLVAANGRIFAEEIHKADPNNVVFNYLDTLNDYPIVLRELMTNPNRWLGQMFRSRDKDILKLNTARVADQILGEYYASKNKEPEPEAKKPAVPVIGKQIQSAGAGTPAVRDTNYWNNYLRKHPRG